MSLHPAGTPVGAPPPRRARTDVARRAAVVALVVLALAAALLLDLRGSARAAEALVPPPPADAGREERLLLVHFVPRDRDPVPAFERRAPVAAAWAADVFRRNLEDQHAAARLGFEMQGGVPRVELVQGRDTADTYRGADPSDETAHYQRVVDEVFAALGPPRGRIYVVFSATHEPEQRCFDAEGSIAMGTILAPDAGAVVIASWVLDEGVCAEDPAGELELFAATDRVRGCLKKDGAWYEAERGRIAGNAIGSLAHELGHALGCFHDFRNPRVDLMGKAGHHFRPDKNSSSDLAALGWIAPENRLVLRWSRFLAADADRGDAREPTFEPEATQPLAAGATSVPLALVIRDDRALGAVVVYAPGSDTLVAGWPAEGTELRLERDVRVAPLAPGVFEIVVLAIDRGGNRAGARLHYHVE
ncbi:MAG: hypothetical protein HZA53_19000 [Planctomycetes bacterium]|nr:hypothetical protein [Planctomycetota bacterium]